MNAGRGVFVAGLLLALPSSVWAQLSRNAPTSRPWDLTIRVFTEYDDNVPLAGVNTSFTGDKGSVRFGTSVSGGYRLIQTKERQAGLGGNFVQMWHWSYSSGAIILLHRASLTVTARTRTAAARRGTAADKGLDVAYALRVWPALDQRNALALWVVQSIGSERNHT
jgi:hypothetical protein